MPQFSVYNFLKSHDSIVKDTGDANNYPVNRSTKDRQEQEEEEVQEEEEGIDDYEFPDRVIIIPSEPPYGDYDTFYNALNDNVLHCRPLLQPLTPIPETSEYSTRSSIASVNPFKSWQSSDLSPSESFENRSGLSRRLLYPYIQPNRSSHESFGGPEKSLKNPVMSVRNIPSNHTESDRARRSYESHSSDGHDGNADLTGSLRTHSSRSSLAEFLRLETSCDGSRGDLCYEEERQLILSQHDLALQELIQSIQDLQRKHLDETTSGDDGVSGRGGLATLASADGSSSSHIAMGSNDADSHGVETTGNLGEKDLSLSSSVPLVSAALPHPRNTTVNGEKDRVCMSNTSLNSRLPPSLSSSSRSSAHSTSVSDNSASVHSANHANQRHLPSS
ncbi:unnamed protein product [Trichobilharzia regenti]|nr:unnamed protein product [Trichobilharzia regenti]